MVGGGERKWGPSREPDETLILSEQQGAEAHEQWASARVQLFERVLDGATRCSH